MPVSEARNDTTPLLRLAFPTHTGHVGMIAPHGVTFVDGVAQNGVTEAAASRLIGSIGPSLSVVGPWADAPPAPPPIVEAAPPAGGDALSLPTSSSARSRRR